MRQHGEDDDEEEAGQHRVELEEDDGQQRGEEDEDGHDGEHGAQHEEDEDEEEDGEQDTSLDARTRSDRAPMAAAAEDSPKPASEARANART